MTAVWARAHRTAPPIWQPPWHHIPCYRGGFTRQQTTCGRALLTSVLETARGDRAPRDGRACPSCQSDVGESVQSDPMVEAEL
jgi:hypothetical protein